MHNVMALKGKDAFNQFFSDTKTHSRGFIPFKGLFLELFAHYRFLRSGARFIFLKFDRSSWYEIIDIITSHAAYTYRKKGEKFLHFLQGIYFPSKLTYTSYSATSDTTS